jgi:hypothetical protein
LNFILDAQGDWKCFPPNEATAWLSVLGTSTLNIPSASLNLAILQPRVSWFPAPFSQSRDLHTTLMILPDKPGSTEIDQAMKLAERLGAETPDGAVFAPQIIVGQLPAGLDLAHYDIIAIGRPSTNSFIAQINDKLPQPFVAKSDELKQVLGQATYRLPPGFDIGVLETIKSPWSQDHAVLIVAGTGQNGVTKALDVLVSLNYNQSELNGDVVFAASNNVAAVDTRGSDAAELLQTQPQALASQSTPVGSSTATRSPAQTVTPGSPLTSTPTSTPGSATPLFTATQFTETPTALPTFVPLPPEQNRPEPIATPSWIFALIGATILITLGSVIYIVIRTRRPRDRDQ